MSLPLCLTHYKSKSQPSPGGFPLALICSRNVKVGNSRSHKRDLYYLKSCAFLAHGMKDIKSSKRGKGPIPHLKKTFSTLTRSMLKELACVGGVSVCVFVCVHLGLLLWFTVIFTMTFLAMLKLDKCAPFFGPSPMCRYSHHLGKK